MKFIPRSVLLASVAFASLAQAASETTPPQDAAPVDQVVVEATRENVAKLRKEVQQSEQRFYERYNQLNKNRDYAIKCSTEASTGTRFTRTECQPVFKSKAQQEEARAFIQAFAGGDPVTGTPGGVSGPPHVFHPDPPPPVSASTFTAATVASTAGRPGFTQNMIDLTTRYPELAKMAQEHAELWARFYALYRQLNGAGPLPEEKSSAAPAPTSSGDPK